MASFNKIILVGNVTRGVDVKNIATSGTSIARTSIAASRRFKDKEEKFFIDLVAFGRNAETMGEFVTIGTSLLVEGRLSMNTWENKDTGERITKYEVVVESFQMLGGRRDREAGAYDATEQSSVSPATERSFGMTQENDVPRSVGRKERNVAQSSMSQATEESSRMTPDTEKSHGIGEEDVPF